jgi:hypothetical protein
MENQTGIDDRSSSKLSFFRVFVFNLIIGNHSRADNPGKFSTGQIDHSPNPPVPDYTLRRWF